ncbi:MAG TPA: CAP domain-containing protein [Solirubrobacteraceae bacterium]
MRSIGCITRRGAVWFVAAAIGIGLTGCGGDESEAASERDVREIGNPVVAEAGAPGGGPAVQRAPDVDALDELPDVGVAGGRGTCGQIDEEVTRAGLAEFGDAILCLVNAERTARGLRALRLHSRLTRASRDHAVDMVRNLYFAHDSRDGRTVLDRVKATGYGGRRGALVGENLGWGSGDYSTPQSVVDGWMTSAGHRANILHRGFRQIGVGVVYGSPRDRGLEPAVTVATDFGGSSGTRRR